MMEYIQEPPTTGVPSVFVVATPKNFSQQRDRFAGWQRQPYHDLAKKKWHYMHQADSAWGYVPREGGDTRHDGMRQFHGNRAEIRQTALRAPVPFGRNKEIL